MTYTHQEPPTISDSDARILCDTLGDGWSYHRSQHASHCTLTGPTGEHLTLVQLTEYPTWERNEVLGTRFKVWGTISPEQRAKVLQLDLYPPFFGPTAITVDAERGPVVLGRELLRRLLPTYTARLRAWEESLVTYARVDALRATTLERMAAAWERAMGLSSVRDRYNRDRLVLRANIPMPGSSVIVSAGGQAQEDVYALVTLNLTDLPPELAERLLVLAGTYLVEQSAQAQKAGIA